MISSELSSILNLLNQLCTLHRDLFRALLNTEALVRMCSVKKVFLEISQNSQKNTCVRVSFLTKLKLINFSLRLLRATFTY